MRILRRDQAGVLVEGKHALERRRLVRCRPDGGIDPRILDDARHAPGARNAEDERVRTTPRRDGGRSRAGSRDIGTLATPARGKKQRRERERENAAHASKLSDQVLSQNVGRVTTSE